MNSLKKSAHLYDKIGYQPQIEFYVETMTGAAVTRCCDSMVIGNH